MGCQVFERALFKSFLNKAGASISKALQVSVALGDPEGKGVSRDPLQPGRRLRACRVLRFALSGYPHPREDAENRTLNWGFQYSNSVEYRALRWIHLLDLPSGLGISACEVPAPANNGTSSSPARQRHYQGRSLCVA